MSEMWGGGANASGAAWGGGSSVGASEPWAGNAPGAGAWGKVTGFVGSALQAFPEFFGHTPSPEVQAFRSANPVSGFVSELLGTGATYGLAAKGLSLIPAATRVVEAAPAFLLGDTALSRPIASMASKFAAETALIEGGRFGARVTHLTDPIYGSDNEVPLGDQVLGSAANIGLAGGLGGIVGAISGRLNTGPRVFDLVPQAHPQEPLTVQARSLDAALKAGGPLDETGQLAGTWTDEQAQMLAYQLEQVKRANFLDVAPGYTQSGNVRLTPQEGAIPNYGQPNTKLVRPLIDDVDPPSGRNYTQSVNALMDPKADPGHLGKTRLLVVNAGDVDPLTGADVGFTKGFATQQDLDDVLSKIGMTKDELALNGQNQRIVTIEPGTGAPSRPEIPPVLPETRGLGQQYHGARGPVGTLGEGYYNPDNIYGGIDTFYTTDAVDVAKGYGRKNPNQMVYSASEKVPVKMFDMEHPRTEAELHKLFSINADSLGPEAEAIETALGDNGGKANVRQVMDEIRANSREHGYSKDDVQDIFGGLTDGLAQQGFGGMTHVGGLRTGRSAHTVKIYFDAPNQLALSEVKLPGPTPAVKSAGDRTAQSVENIFMGNKTGTDNGPFQRVGANQFLAREGENGMWVQAIKIEGEIGKPKAGDQWFLQRTDNPDLTNPQGANFRDLTVDKAAYYPDRTTPNIGSDVYDLANTYEQNFGAMTLIPKGVKPSVTAFAAAGKQIGEGMIDFLANAMPTAGVLGRSNKGNYALGMAQMLKGAEQAKVKAFLHGTAIIDQSKGVMGQTLKLSEPMTGGAADFYKTLKPNEWVDVQNMLEAEVPYEQLRELAHAGQISPNAYQVLSQLETVSRANVAEIEKLKVAAGAPNAVHLVEDFAARAGHYGLSQTRDGGFYQMIDDARTGEWVGHTSGNTAKEARDKAVALIAKEAKTTGKDLALGGGQNTMNRSIDDVTNFITAIRKPGFLKARGDWLGAEIGNGPLNAEKFTKLVERSLNNRERFKSNIVLQEKLWPVLSSLYNEDQTTWNQLVKRVGGTDPLTGGFRPGIMQGDEGTFAKWQNAVADKVLMGALGKDSASKIVQQAQHGLSAFTFGFGNISHYVTNAITFLQTTFPQAAFVMRAAGQDMSNYVSLPLVDGGGKIADSVNMVSDVKLFGASLRRAFGASNEPEWHDLVQSMLQQGVISGKFAESHFGAQGEIVKNLKGAWEDGRSFTRWLGAANGLMQAKTEEFSRVIGVATAYEAAKLLHAARPEMNMMDPFRLANFTREFISKSTYNYTTFDKPQVFTTPVGSLLGTFKTWMFHYMMNMAQYGGAAVGRQMWAPLLWQTGATAALGGLAATPLIMPMANAASKWLTNKSFMDNSYNNTTVPSKAADFMMYGFPGLFGLSIASQASSPGADPMRDASMLWSMASLDRMRAFGQAAGDAIAAYKATGQSPFEDDQVRNEFIRALAPRTVYRAMSAMENHAITSLNNGYRVLDNVSLGDAALYTMGFNPVNLDKTYVAYNELRNTQTGLHDATQELGRQLGEAWTDGDTNLATRIYASGIAQGLDMGSVQRSAKAHIERGSTTQLQFAIGKDKKGAALAQDWNFIGEQQGGTP